ncbi:tyramine receptor Ser-2-like [Patiria miniata]|uniref:G-protein coupled receptors family 1 profile domain-containing protein n=1 Tax=Patiria miniata TaxID=46514 RepID=A0A913ZUE8_PATMI|nr:tyramine receptor Ser-2-like [Patiria miniata]
MEMNASIINTTSVYEVVDYATTDRAKAIGLVIYNVFIIVIGVPGNCLILRVYWGKSHKCSTHILIMGLAVADLTICLLRLWDVTLNSSILSGTDIPDLTETFNSFDYTAVGTSIMVTAVIALDRYDCVCRPNRRLMTHQRARKALLIAVVLSVAVNVPVYVRASLDGSHVSLSLDVVIYIFQVTSFVLPIMMISACYSIVFLAIRKHVKVRVLHPKDDQILNIQTDWSTRSHPSICVSTVSRQVGVSTRPLGLSPGRVERRHRRQNRELSHTQKRTTSKDGKAKDRQQQLIGRRNVVANSSTADSGAARSTQPPRRPGPVFRRTQGPSPALQRRTTVMLFITSVVFILCWLPYWVKALLEIFGGKSDFLDTFMEVLYINNAINPFIYGLANRRFRKDCKNVFRKMRIC